MDFVDNYELLRSKEKFISQTEEIITTMKKLNIRRNVYFYFPPNDLSLCVAN